jgi:methylated-DNA-protein-cysteine methyltransferase-like protein
MKAQVTQATYRQQVFDIVRQVPAGKVITYRRVAAMIAPPVDLDQHAYVRIGSQWVGRALHVAPEGVPWHRVINSRGQISLPAGSRGAAIQRLRLEAEGIQFDRNGRVDLRTFGWTGSPDPQLIEQGPVPVPPASAQNADRPRLV